MASNKRQSISKKTRFEVFKRDAFTCQYCGAHPPGILLHVDHIVPVAGGGVNHMDNYVTSCDACNLGKGARSLSVVPQSLSEKAKAVAEREEQLLGYQSIMEAKRERLDAEIWRVAEIIEPGSPSAGMDRDWTNSIRKFLEKLGLHEVLDSADIARAKYRYGGRRTFLYFCGVCWTRIRQQQEATNGAN